MLSLYCYYLPLLAYNGILEAFVAAVASPAQLKEQSKWMLAFSLAYVGAGWLLLGVWGLGAEGLVGANAVNMGVRILWCKVWVEGWWAAQMGDKEGAGQENEKRDGQRKTRKVPVFKVLSTETLPKMRTASVGVAAWSVLVVLQRRYFDGGLMDLVVAGGVAGVAGLTM